MSEVIEEDIVPKFDPTKKKKKKRPAGDAPAKKKKPVAQAAGESSSSSSSSSAAAAAADGSLSEPTDLTSQDGTLTETTDTNIDNDDDEVFERVLDDHEYTYEELLERVFSVLQANNPDLMSARRHKTVFTIPEVFRSTKKTVWNNFQLTAKAMNRSPEHFSAFISSELGTTSQIDGSKRLVVNGRFNPRQLENVEKKYIEEYIICKTCKSHDTNLKKENRLFFVQCKLCGSQRTVAAVKAGYLAQVGRRKK